MTLNFGDSETVDVIFRNQRIDDQDLEKVGVFRLFDPGTETQWIEPLNFGHLGRRR